MVDLLDPADPDYASYKAGDEAFLLKAVGDTIREYCGWHIAPSVTETIDKLPIGAKGILMVPSLHITAVSAVTVHANPTADPVLLDPGQYTWYRQGYITPVGNASFGTYYYEPGPTLQPLTDRGYASVSLTHGYATLPNDIKWVAYELAGWAKGLGADGAGGDIKQIKSPGFSLSLGGVVSLGMNLNPDQKGRLAHYKIGGVK